jgi:nucleotide-binding universal stress UspA family protein
MEFKHLILPTDFSPAAQNAFYFACKLAHKTGGEIHLVHIYEPPYYSESIVGGQFTLEVDQAAQKKLYEQIEAELHKMISLDVAKGLKVYRRLIPEIKVWDFPKYIEPGKADMIIMGTRGATNVWHGGIVGTNTERVIRTAPVPVLAVHKDSVDYEPQRILFATDFRDPLDDIFPRVLAYAKLWDSEVIVGMISTRDTYGTSRFAREKYQELAAKFPYEKMRLVVHNDDSVEEGIMDLIEVLEIHLVAMLTHGRTGIAHLIRGSIAEDLAAHIRTPLLTLKNKK